MQLNVAIFVTYLIRRYQLKLLWKNSFTAKLSQLIKAITGIDIAPLLKAHANAKLQISKQKIAILEAELEKIKQGHPFEYAVGITSFYSSDFLTSKDVLIPRVESERLIDLIIEYIDFQKRQNTPVSTIADIGTGSGCLGISVLKKLQDTQSILPDMYLIDTSSAALNIAQTNAKNILGALSNIHYQKSNLLEYFLDKNQKIDVIIANLPYVQDWYLELKKNYYEPSMALNGGLRGMDCLSQFVTACRKLCSLSSHPIHVFIECDTLQTDELSYIINTEGVKHMTIHYDQFSFPRFISLDYTVI